MCVWSGAGGQLAGRAATINTSNEETQTQEETLIHAAHTRDSPGKSSFFFSSLVCLHHHPVLHLGGFDQVLKHFFILIYSW